ncbi:MULTISPECIES: enolase C-terminal domain-like protein [Rhodopseudomonas]|uniref:Mandelate racemase n=1 Tax=Rhodopseudomonas palustris TaxID=1076 RepID=A0A0D7F2F4_RHOPL|nr:MULTISPECIES: enolase C-terminal domain-like protein [Rhodopseudomonas]KIZ47229.1 mandelate racemase [Rhodopseudomonas palustris]MDF3812613.1 enolase C-terminal domain-like protein [Rhodopseudomonas sp. BAL398]WOK17716.1 enolase C-terminal domain-like protein [Rhodopseudomonas sp. BAL398]
MMSEVTIDRLDVRAFTIPTDRPEADGTLAWDKTTIVLVEAHGDGKTGLGYTYSSDAILGLITGKLAGVVEGRDALNPQGAWRAMQRSVRNLGREGLAATAISAVDSALYDLKARLLGVPLATLLGRYRDAVPIYGSGGFTSYSDKELREQLGGWVANQGCAFVKMKVGSEPARDPARVRAAKDAIGDRATLFVDANGAYGVQQALRLAEQFAQQGVGWFEEPVSSDDLRGLCAVRARAPFGMDVAAGEYAYTTDYARHMLAAEAVDVMQADVTRCGGITGFLQIAAVCEAFHTDLSGHCAPALHLHVACAAPRLRHLEWFHDHVRIEHMLFDGAPVPRDGALHPDLSQPGHGLAFKAQDAARYAA